VAACHLVTACQSCLLEPPCAAGPVPGLLHHAARLAKQARLVCCSKIAEAEAVLVCQRKEVVSDAYACAAEARRASGPPQPLAHCDIKVSAQLLPFCCSKIAEAEAAVSVNEKKWLVVVMHMHVQLQLDELRGPQTLGSLSWMLHQSSTVVIGAGLVCLTHLHVCSPA
jgi:hypothetical protein